MNSEKDHILSELMLVRYQRGDASALDELIRHWEGRLFYYIRRLVTDEDDAWDALQDTWLALVNGIRGLREPRSLPMWLYRTARHKAMDRLRARYDDRAACFDSEDLAEIEETVDEFSFEDAEQVHQALSKLSLNHREVLTLYFLEDLSMDDISLVLSVATGTVKSRLHYAKRALRTILEEEAGTV